MINPSERNEIIKRCENGDMISETAKGKYEKWWKNKHDPDGLIPRNIYLLGGGTIKELHSKYITKYGNIEWSNFINYTRELIKQKIMI